MEKRHAHALYIAHTSGPRFLPVTHPLTQVILPQLGGYFVQFISLINMLMLCQLGSERYGQERSFNNSECSSFAICRTAAKLSTTSRRADGEHSAQHTTTKVRFIFQRSFRSPSTPITRIPSNFISTGVYKWPDWVVVAWWQQGSKHREQGCR